MRTDTREERLGTTRRRGAPLTATPSSLNSMAPVHSNVTPGSLRMSKDFRRRYTPKSSFALG
eukprot:3803717-Lingulodinium_polyedra.AAC.1